ncbi:helix-turn-helix domain-containing protein, partial [Lewinella sp. JB7]
MPFEEVNRMDQRKAFILDYLSDQYYFNSICEKYHISRKTGYKWVKRYR